MNQLASAAERKRHAEAQQSGMVNGAGTESNGGPVVSIFFVICLMQLFMSMCIWVWDGCCDTVATRT